MKTRTGLDVVQASKPGHTFLLRNRYEQVIHFRLDHVKPEHVNGAGKRFYFLFNADRAERYPNCYSESDLRDFSPVCQ